VKANPLYKKNCGAGLLRGRREKVPIEEV